MMRTIEDEECTDWNSIIKEEFGGAEGIYILHCISPEQCPCKNFHECVGVYKLLKWNTWIEWRKENCIIQGSPTCWLRDKYISRVFPQIPY